MGAALFVLAPPFRYVLPVHRPDSGHQAWFALLGAAAVGALVAAIAGRRRGWLVAAASALVGTLLSLARAAAPGPPFYPEYLGWAYAASGMLYFFAFTFPPAALGALAAELALDLLPKGRFRRRSRHRRSRRRRPGAPGAHDR